MELGKSKGLTGNLIVNSGHVIHLRQPKLNKKTILSHKKNSSCGRKNRMNIYWKRRNDSCYRKYTLCHRKKIITSLCLRGKIFLVTKQNANHSCDRKYTFVAHTALLVTGGVFPVTWTIPMPQEKLPVTGRIPNNIFHRRNFSCERKNISCPRKFTSSQRSRKEHLVSQEFLSVKEHLLSQEHLVISKLIPWLCVSYQSCHWVQLCVDYCLDDDEIFPRCFGQKYSLEN